MGIISTVMVVLTAVGLIFGALFGLIRGRNRSILRFSLILVSVLGAIFLREPLTNVVMNIEVEGAPLKDTLLAMFQQGDFALPQSILDLFFNLIKVVLGIVAYFIAFGVLRFITWVLVFPICKIFVKREEEKKGLFGALIGLGQGVIIVFAMLVPLNGLVMQVDKVASLKMQGEPIIEVPADIGLHDYIEGPLSKTFNAIGGWYFNIISSAEDLSIEDAFDMATTIAGVADSVAGLTGSMEVLQKEDATTEEKVGAMQDVGDKLIEMGESIDNLSDDAKEVINDVLKDMGSMISGGEEVPPEVQEVLDNLTIDSIDLGAMGHAMKGIGSVIEKQEHNQANPEDIQEISQEDVSNIVTGIAGNMQIIEMITGESDETPTLIELEGEEAQMFEDAIADQVANSGLSEEDAETLRKLVGLYQPQTPPAE